MLSWSVEKGFVHCGQSVDKKGGIFQMRISEHFVAKNLKFFANSA